MGPTVDIDAIEKRHEIAGKIALNCGTSPEEAASADDIPALLQLVRRLTAPRSTPSELDEDALEKLVKWLADPYEWTWTLVVSYRDAADCVLRHAAELGIIGQQKHPSGGNVWIINGRRYGRTD